MFKTITDRIARDTDFPERQRRIDVLTRVLDGTIYDLLPHGFHIERNEAGEYIPLRDRRPSVRSGLIQTVVDDSVSLLFSEGHFPTPNSEDDGVKTFLAAVIKESKLNEVMIEAATKGSVGSVAILLKALKNSEGKYRLFFTAMPTGYLTPTWRANEPDKLEKVREQYKVKGAALKASGYTVDDKDLSTEFWFAREWGESAETWFMPWKVRETDVDAPAAQIDDQRTVKHDLGFVPMVWVKNLPGGDDIDGACTFTRAAIDTVIEIDYLLSQGGRGLKYASDPTLLLKEPAGGDSGQLVRSASNAIVVDKDGDGKLLEINGTASEALIGWVRALRELAIESMHGNRANPDKLSAAQSGRAMELLNQALVWLADRLRIQYGEGALLDLLTMAVRITDKLPITVAGHDYKNLGGKKPVSLVWPKWFPLTASDRQQNATTLKTLMDAGAISQETGIKSIADDYDIEDVETEIKRISDDRAKAKPVVPGAQVTETVAA